MNLGTIGSLVIELKAEGADSVEKEINKATKSTENMGVKAKKAGSTTAMTFGSLTKVAGVLGAAMMAVQSPVIFSYLQEFGDLLGFVGDTIFSIFGPFIDYALDALWGLAEWFETQSPLLLAAVMPLLPAWKLFIDFIAGVGKVVLLGLIQLIADIIKFVTDLFTALYNKDWAGAWNVIATAAQGVFDWLVTNVLTPILNTISFIISNWDWGKAWKLLSDGLGEVWEHVIRPLLPTWLGNFLDEMAKFFKADGAGKLQMIGETIMKGMNWLTLAKAAAETFVIQFLASVRSSLRPSYGEIGFYTWNPPPGGVEGEYQNGTDYVPRTGPYLLHQGEKVIPAGESEAGSQSFNMTFNITGGGNVQELAAEVMRLIQTESRRLA